MKQLELQIQHLQLHNVSYHEGSDYWELLFFRSIALNCSLINQHQSFSGAYGLINSKFCCCYSQNALEEDVANLQKAKEENKSNKKVKCFSWLAKLFRGRNNNNNNNNDSDNSFEKDGWTTIELNENLPENLI